MLQLKRIDLVVIALTLLGCVLLAQVQWQLASLHKELTRIEAAVGEMEIVDPQVAQILAIDTHHPWQWAWRLYVPDNFQGRLNYTVGKGSTGSMGFSSSQQEFIARLSLNQLKDGRFGLYNRFEGTSSFSSFGSKEFCDFLMDHRDELVVEQFGSAGVEPLQAGGPAVVLFRMRLPEPLIQQAEKQFQDRLPQNLIPTVLEVTLDLP